MPKDRGEYMRAYYEANKAKLCAKRRNPQPRETAGRAEERYREKQRILKEICDGKPVEDFGFTPISDLVQLPDGTVMHKDDVPA